VPNAMHINIGSRLHQAKTKPTASPTRQTNIYVF